MRYVGSKGEWGEKGGEGLKSQGDNKHWSRQGTTRAKAQRPEKDSQVQGNREKASVAGGMEGCHTSLYVQ